MAVVPTAYSCCVAIPISDAKHTLGNLANKSSRRVGKYSVGKQGVCTKVPSYHLSLVEFTAPTQGLAKRISGLAVKAIKSCAKFKITAHKGKVDLFNGIKKDFVVLPVKTKEKNSKKPQRNLVDLSNKVNKIITKNGGKILFPTFKPHITLGKVSPKNVSGPVRLPKAKHVSLSVDPKKCFSYKPFAV